MGPHYKNDETIPTWDGLPFFGLSKKIPYQSLVLEIKENTTINQYVYFYVQPDGSMESGSRSFLSPEEAARLGNEAVAAAAASAAAAAAKMKSANTSSATGNPSLPANSGFVQTANPPIPPSERSKLIRINRELRYKPTVLGGGGEALHLWIRLRIFTHWVMGGWAGPS
jgi:hypothetical protein